MRLTKFHDRTPVCFCHEQSSKDVLRVLKFIKERCKTRDSLTGLYCMVVGMPNIGKSSLLNALRREGVEKGKVAPTGAQPGVTRKIGTGVKIIDSADDDSLTDAYLLDTPGVFIPYVPDSDAMLKLAVCGCVKDSVVHPFTQADYLLYHINQRDPGLYSQYHSPTNSITELLEAMARQTGRLRKGGIPDLDASAMWMIQRWRNGHLGHFILDDVSDEAFANYRADKNVSGSSISQAVKADKKATKERAKSKKATAGG